MKRNITRSAGIITMLCLPGILLNATGKDMAEPVRTMGEKLFRAMDTNSDGKVTKDEYFSFGEAYMQEQGKRFNPSTAERNFAAFDVDGNGVIEPDDAKPPELALDDPRKIIGVWRHFDSENYGFITFVFDENGQADMITGYTESTRRMALERGGSMTYTYDPSTTPASLDIVAVGGSGPATIMKCIVKFQKGGRLKMRIAHGKDDVQRPEGFPAENPGDMLYLKRSETQPCEMRHF
ncbi:hypothetical protein PDESU_04435 [Pontiella desulfatans]|uniref:EF-hand domain-containing protein n=1 Tax=Pontiella desulfatans TaxID=2750659 RepID=A0A6C2U6Z9_PONDE|nr:EF-hand domain-containing protein [Pontiella desulfatans]VGO15848.1 hypothetical protein PDESU_04435 [Pontiella desulfatans]